MQNWKKNFAIIWTGQLVSLVSSSLVNFAIIIWLSIETASAEVLAYAAIAGMIPQTVLGLFVGVYIDKWDRKLVMILSDAFIAGCTLAIAGLLYFGKTELGYIYLLLALRSVGSAFHFPSMQASIPLLAPAEELLRISGINQAILSVSIIAGPALGALAIGTFPIEYVLLIDIAGAFVAIVSLLLVSIPNPERPEEEKKESMWAEIALGIKAVLSYKGLGVLFLFSVLVTFFIMPVAVLFPLMTLQHFNGTPFQMSIIEAVWGIGMLLGGSLLGLVKARFNKVVLINLTYMVMGGALSISGLLSSSQFVWFAALTTAAGLAFTVYNASFTAVIQERIDPVYLGRVFSMFTSVSLFPSILGLLGTGFLADHVGIALTFVIFGGAVAAVGVVSFLFRDVTAVGKAGA